MKVHVLSHRRSGSKSVVSALETVLGRSHKALQEILHMPFCHEYKFGTDDVEPFSGDVHFVGSTPNFHSLRGRNFLPTWGRAFGDLTWITTHYRESLSWEEAARVARSAITDGNLRVAKTQVGYLHRKFNYDPAFLNQLSQFTASNFDAAVVVYPKELARWVASNWSCDSTGIFVPITEQLGRATEIPREIPIRYVEGLLRQHRSLLSLLSFLPAETPVLYTEELSSVGSVKLSELVGQEVVVLNEPEYSLLDYSTFFQNYDTVQRIVDRFTSESG